MANLTLCFLKYQNSILLINRNKAPFMGMWNAIGGHQEKGETLLECAIREIYEETNIKIEKLNFMGKFTWNFDDDIGYIYVGNLEKDFNINNYPLKNEEGIVDFKSIEWIENSHNTGIINLTNFSLIPVSKICKSRTNNGKHGKNTHSALICAKEWINSRSSSKMT